MTATTSPNRANRVAPYFAEPRRTLPPLPATAEARQEALADAVFAAVAALQEQLAHPDPAVSLKAAIEILDFEKTRLRHGRSVAGTTAPPPPDLSAVLEDLTAPAAAAESAADEPADDELIDDLDDDEGSDPFLEGGRPPVDFGKFVRDVYQALVAARELGLAEFVTVFDAERVAEAVVEKREALRGGDDEDDIDDG